MNYIFRYKSFNSRYKYLIKYRFKPIYNKPIFIYICIIIFGEILVVVNTLLGVFNTLTVYQGQKNSNILK